MIKAIVTGHSRGLGAAIASKLLGRGIAVLGLARARNDNLAGHHPELLEQVEIDLADAAALAQWIDGGALDAWLADAGTALLVNNAGTVQPIGPLPSQGAAAVSKAVALNVAAPLMLSAAFVARCRPGTDCRVLNVSSGAGRHVYPGWSVYCATKAALDHHARAVVLDKTPGLRICSLAPGVIDTDMQAEIRSTDLERFPVRERFEAMKRDGVLVSADECAGRIVGHLLGDAFGEQPVADLRELGASGKA
ncbi:SDR family oxidoreductase [Burkholderiaceae bacterium FT117]|uniref:SDR family oxidoreductase n=1 Tax=Zeimonas sediminis TaxID=2944268 RepID=UPI002342D3B5|nr:SDR family oxidoreductase [Zeimonas sediminis]MCM5570103.1 SDR family oxidoreductase [Zeimonas sediminis]